MLYPAAVRAGGDTAQWTGVRGLGGGRGETVDGNLLRLPGGLSEALWLTR
jgi:hypothetical protein